MRKRDDDWQQTHEELIQLRLELKTLLRSAQDIKRKIDLIEQSRAAPMPKIAKYEASHGGAEKAFEGATRLLLRIGESDAEYIGRMLIENPDITLRTLQSSVRNGYHVATQNYYLRWLAEADDERLKAFECYRIFADSGRTWKWRGGTA